MPSDETSTADMCAHAGARPGARFCAECGAAIPAAPPPAEPDRAAEDPLSGGDSSAAPRRSVRQWWREDQARWAARRRRLPPRLVRPVAIVAAVLAAAVVALYVVQDRWYGPEEPVRALFAALEAGDGAAAADLLGVDPADHPLLAPGALDVGYQAPTGFTITNVEHDVSGEWVVKRGGGGFVSEYVEDHTKRPDMEHARITIGYELGGEDYTMDLDATREDSGWFRSWSLNPAVLETTIVPSSTAAGAVQLAGITTGELGTITNNVGDESPVNLLALPGVYTITAEGTDLWEAGEHAVAVPLGAEDEWVSVSSELRTDAVEAVVREVESHIDACIAAGGVPDAECGFREDSGWLTLVPDSAVWTLAAYPVVEVTPADDGAEWPLEVRTTTPGAASVTYETVLDEARTITVEVHANGAAGAEGGAFTFDPRACDIGSSYC